MIRTLSIFTLALVGIGILYLTQLHQQTQQIGTSLSPSTTSYDTLKSSTITTSEHQHQHQHEHDDIHDHELHAGHDHHEHLDETDDAEHAAARRAKRAKKDFHHHRGITKEKEDQIHREMEELHRLMEEEENIKKADAAEAAKKVVDNKEVEQVSTPTSPPKSDVISSASASPTTLSPASALSNPDSSTKTSTSTLKKTAPKKTGGFVDDLELDDNVIDGKKKTKVS